MRAGISLEVPKLYGTVVGATDHYFFGELDQFGDMRGVLVREVSDEVACGDVPHLYGLVQACAEEGHVVLEQDDGPDEVQVASHGLETGRAVFFGQTPYLNRAVCASTDQGVASRRAVQAKDIAHMASKVLRVFSLLVVPYLYRVIRAA